MPDDRYAVTDEERDELMAWIAGLDVPAAVAKTLARGCDLTMIQDAWCSKCGGRVPVRYPDYKAMKGFIDLLFQYKLQKPSELRQIDINVRQIHAREQLERLSDAELLELAAAEDAEWQPLPPAA